MCLAAVIVEFNLSDLSTVSDYEAVTCFFSGNWNVLNPGGLIHFSGGGQRVNIKFEKKFKGS